MQKLKTSRLAIGVGAILAGLALFPTEVISGVPDGVVPEEGLVVPGVGEPGGPERELDETEAARFLVGLQLFDHDFHFSDGLGAPEMNADSCRACHQEPAIGGAGGLELNVSRFGFDDGGKGPFVNVPGGQGLSKFRPPFVGGREEYDPLTADVFEQRQTPSLFGAGLIDGISDSEIMANEDLTDFDGDGIFGFARRVGVGPGVTEIGRFGWKAQVPHLRDFILDAMGGECGITTPDDGRGFALVSDADTIADPELSNAEIDDLLFYMSLLAAPRRTNSLDQNVLLGEVLFETVGCTKCHIPTLMGESGPVPLYSDLLLHDIAISGYRGMSEPGAPSGVFQTKPLWGISKTAPYMHDGQYESLARAIIAHHGEGEAARDAYLALQSIDKRRLILFLEDL